MADTAMPPPSRRFGPAWSVGGLFLLAGLASLLLLDRQLPPDLWWRAMVDPDPVRLDQLAAHYVLFPRFAVALLMGAALGLAGTILQQVLRNPLAEPATLGISTGAHLSLAVATLWVPEALALGREWVALAGAALSSVALLALSWRKGLSPVTVVLHDVNMAASFCDDIVALHGGRLIDRGTPAEIMTPARLGAIYGLPMAVIPHPDSGEPVGLVR